MVVNKGDRPGAEQTLHQLMGALSIRAMRNQAVPVLKTTATTGEGVPELVAAVTEKGRALDAGGPMARRRGGRAISSPGPPPISSPSACAPADRQRWKRSPMKC